MKYNGGAAVAAATLCCFAVGGHATLRAQQELVRSDTRESHTQTGRVIVETHEFRPRADLPRLRQAAQSGDPEAQYSLGASYILGNDGVRQDASEGASWLHRAANQGHRGAQYNLGVLYAQGHYGVLRNASEGASWYRRAADQGHPLAQHNLANMYRAGEGVPQDYEEAIRWYRSAAEQGHAHSQYALGFHYAIGLGVPQDYAEAVQWYRLAVERGHADSRLNLQRLYDAGVMPSQEPRSEGSDDAIADCRINLELGPGDSCNVGYGRFQVDRGGLGSYQVSSDRMILSINSSANLISARDGFRARLISNTGVWRVEALP